MTRQADSGKQPYTTTTADGGVTIKWHDDEMATVFANIGTATANREEFYLLFGNHQNWRNQDGESRQIDVNLSTRVVMNPYAVKRLQQVLAASIKAYEDQFGKIDV